VLPPSQARCTPVAIVRGLVPSALATTSFAGCVLSSMK
jgi:hypothetical protein